MKAKFNPYGALLFPGSKGIALITGWSTETESPEWVDGRAEIRWRVPSGVFALAAGNDKRTDTLKARLSRGPQFTTVSNVHKGIWPTLHLNHVYSRRLNGHALTST